jgi:hypothetical protein
VRTEFVSPDGVIADPGGVEGFEHRGSVLETDQGDRVQFKLDEALASVAMLLGWETYETCATPGRRLGRQAQLDAQVGRLLHA